MPRQLQVSWAWGGGGRGGSAPIGCPGRDHELERWPREAGPGRRAGCRGRGPGGTSWVPVQAARLTSCLCCVRRGIMYPLWPPICNMAGSSAPSPDSMRR